MTTAIDSNIFVALWDEDEPSSPAIRPVLDSVQKRGGLIVAAPVYAELLAFPSRSEAFLDRFFSETGIFGDWNLDESVWRAAGHSYQAFAARRRKHGHPTPRRILADFLIGAHALRNGCSLLTLDDRFFRVAFPQLTVVAIQNP